MIHFYPLGNDDVLIGSPVAISVGYPALFCFVRHKTVPVSVINCPVADSEHANPYGDKSCHHVNAQGDIHLIHPSMIKTGPTPRPTTSLTGGGTVKSGPAFMPLPSYTFRPSPTSTKSLNVTHLLSYGQSYSESLAPLVIEKGSGSKAYTYYISDMTIELRWVREDRAIILAKRHQKQIRTNTSIVIDDSIQYDLVSINFDLTNNMYSYCRLTGSTSPNAPVYPYNNLTDIRPDKSASNCFLPTSGFGDVSAVQAQAITYVGGLLHVVKEHPLDLPIGIWGELAHIAAQGAQSLNINSAMYLADLVKIRDTIKAIKGLRRLNLKSVSKAYLAEHYGISLTIDDTLAIRDAVKRLGKKNSKQPYAVTRAALSASSTPYTFRGAYIVPHTSLHYKIYYDPVDRGWQGTVRSLMDWDFFPTLQNVWDFIPFSFVVDWVVDVEGALARQDTKTYLSVLDVLSVLKSTRTTIPAVNVAQILPDWLGKCAFGSVSIVLYDRWSQPGCDLPLPMIDRADTFNNYVEATALILSRGRQ